MNPAKAIYFDCLVSGLSLCLWRHTLPVLRQHAHLQTWHNFKRAVSNLHNRRRRPGKWFPLFLVNTLVMALHRGQKGKARSRAACLQKRSWKQDVVLLPLWAPEGLRSDFQKQSVSGMFDFCQPECDLILWQGSLLSAGFAVRAEDTNFFFPSWSSQIQSLHSTCSIIGKECASAVLRQSEAHNAGLHTTAPLMRS